MTSIRWFIDRTSHVNISIYDFSGQLVSKLWMVAFWTESVPLTGNTKAGA